MFSALSRVNVVTPTLGGRQFWGDVAAFHGYRIQQNVVTGHYRLLNEKDFRLAWGSEESCRAALTRIQEARHLPPMSGRVVILLHGITRSSKSFTLVRRRLESAGMQVIGFDYPSTRLPLKELARYLDRLLKSLDEVTEIDFVVHSMGGLLVRTYLQQAGDQWDRRIRSMVMLGVPNLGARMATLLNHRFLFQLVFGPAGKELQDGEASYVLSLPVPPFPFGIIAGARGTEEGWNPFIPGDDDGTVSVSATRLPGATDFMTVRSQHTLMMWNPELADAVLRFLQTGAFREDGLREPIPAEGEKQLN